MAHSLQSNESHPLLRDQLRLIATPVASVGPGPGLRAEEEELAESMGTLTLDGHGSRYFGSMAAFAVRLPISIPSTDSEASFSPAYVACTLFFL